MIWTRWPMARVNAENPARIVLGERILDGENGEALDPAEEQLDHAVGVEFTSIAGELVAPLPTEFGGRDVE